MQGILFTLEFIYRFCLVLALFYTVLGDRGEENSTIKRRILALSLLF